MAGSSARVGHAARLARAALVVALSAGYFAYVFQLRQGTWRTAGLSGWMDPYFVNALLEHWYFSVRHVTDPASPPMFYPLTGTLGYSHGLVLYAPFYIAVRPWTHPFAAQTLTLFLVLETGALSLYVVLRKFLRLGFVESILLAAFFCTSGNVINDLTESWSQQLSVFLIPSILLLALWSARPGRDAIAALRTCAAGLAGLLATLLFTQDYYTGLLTFVLTGVTAVGARLVLGPLPLGLRINVVRAGPHPIVGLARRIFAWLALLAMVIGLAWAMVSVQGTVLGIRFESHHHHWERPAIVALASLAAFVAARGGIRTRLRFVWLGLPRVAWALAAGMVLGLLIFLRVYLRAALEHPAFPEWQTLGAILPRDLSDWRHPLDLARRAVGYEDARSWIAVVVVTVTASIAGRQVTRRSRLGSLWWLGVTVCVALVAIRVNGYSLWTSALAWLPGFGAIRDPKRIIFPYELLTTIALGLFLADLPRRSGLRIAMTLLVAALLAGDWNAATFAYRRPMAPFDRYVQAPIAIDASCRSFFVARASGAYRARSPESYWLLYALDATFIAARYGIPTLNGFSAWYPDQWWQSALADPEGPDYAAGAGRWVRLHGLRDVCVLDIEARTMTRYDPAAGR